MDIAIRQLQAMPRDTGWDSVMVAAWEEAVRGVVLDAVTDVALDRVPMHRDPVQQFLLHTVIIIPWTQARNSIC